MLEAPAALPGQPRAEAGSTAVSDAQNQGKPAWAGRSGSGLDTLMEADLRPGHAVDAPIPARSSRLKPPAPLALRSVFQISEQSLLALQRAARNLKLVRSACRPGSSRPCFTRWVWALYRCNRQRAAQRRPATALAAGGCNLVARSSVAPMNNPPPWIGQVRQRVLQLLATLSRDRVFCWCHPRAEAVPWRD